MDRICHNISCPSLIPGFVPWDLGAPQIAHSFNTGGVDDALAILLALASPDSLCVEGLSIALGNGKDERRLSGEVMTNFGNVINHPWEW